ncbi:MAG: efflux RND transporter periplasmic adaptor subunit [Treponema sp.]|jgi:multidrug efflux pump subunit AcrA (membrane-fusion protein)|nr:efflux RND transporter periplasmic adaptor subunit [Treponema sp.]
MMKKRHLFPLAAVAAAFLAFACGNKENDAADSAAGGGEPEAPLFAVNTSTAAKGLIRDYLALSGDIVAASTVDAYPEAAGKVTRLYVSIGSRVSRGQALAAIDPSRPGMEYEAYILRAPVAGTIVALPAQIGMTLSQAAPAARIAAGTGADTALEIKLYVAERFLSRVRQEQTCEILLDAYPGEVFRGTVAKTSPIVDPASRTMETTVSIGSSGGRLKPGMFAKVKIITERKEGVVKIPDSAIVRRFGEEYVFAAVPDEAREGGFVARKRLLRTGILIDGIQEVEEGLAPGEEFVVRGQTLLSDGSRINIVDRVAPLAEH